jgi:hypothetical protein
VPLGKGPGALPARMVAPLYRATMALCGHRRRRPYHAALEATVDGVVTVLEMTPVWIDRDEANRVFTGRVGASALATIPLFRYVVWCWPGGTVHDASAVVHRVRLTDDTAIARRLIELIDEVPRVTWGRDDQEVGEMWTSNSLVSWLLTRTGVDAQPLRPPSGGRAPGWDAGIRTGRS